MWALISNRENPVMARRLDYKKNSRVAKARNDIRETIEDGTFSQYSVKRKPKIDPEYECDQDDHDISWDEITWEDSDGVEDPAFRKWKDLIDAATKAGDAGDYPTFEARAQEALSAAQYK